MGTVREEWVVTRYWRAEDGQLWAVQIVARGRRYRGYMYDEEYGEFVIDGGQTPAAVFIAAQRHVSALLATA